MRDANVFAVRTALPRMAWGGRNLFNLLVRSFGHRKEETDFRTSTKTLFQQRFISKKLVRAYHGDHINEKAFKRWYLPTTLPDVRPRKVIPGDDTALLSRWAKRNDDVERIKKAEERASETALAPVGSLMFREVERRIDVFIFRSCFAHSVYEARRLVVHGRVLLNGKLHMNANTRLAPGDMVSVDPGAISFLRFPESSKKIDTKANEDEQETEDAEATAMEGEENEAAEEKASEEKAAEEKADKKAAYSEQEKQNNPALTGQPWAKNRRLTPFILPPFSAPFIFIPAYIEPCFTTCSAVYVRHPTAKPGYSEIPTPYDADGEVVRLAWEWYAKRRPRMRSRSQLARMPENRESSGF
ncbi:hypothetical protein M422DRAFT_779403 [Sphaerobolus stellatus SS14]|uniref:RNA-binding S4 domain-containing protein n=1 Tax=Sphaerobolus stellatus (strain SS14) TaxID=990650 RepID=A0A0C9UMT9_SPHS4|nr:hypothetical protein M422DRAFT_779403 [Sphaerobolus stellatus SS14]